MRFRVVGDTIVFDDGGMNLLSSDALHELRDVIAGLRGCEVAKFRSGRSHIFAAGADMAEMARFSASEAEAFARLGQETFDAIERLPCLTMAIVDGDCFGGALDLILAFDLRFASARSRFSHPGGKIGIVTGFGGTSRWRKVVDSAAARRLFLGNEILDAQSALEIGLIDGIGEPSGPPFDIATIRVIKDLIVRRDRLTQRDLALLAERLAALYDAAGPRR